MRAKPENKRRFQVLSAQRPRALSNELEARGSWCHLLVERAKTLVASYKKCEHVQIR